MGQAKNTARKITVGASSAYGVMTRRRRVVGGATTVRLSCAVAASVVIGRIPSYLT
jgi:hypothetical protein